MTPTVLGAQADNFVTNPQAGVLSMATASVLHHPYGYNPGSNTYASDTCAAMTPAAVGELRQHVRTRSRTS